MRRPLSRSPVGVVCGMVVGAMLAPSVVAQQAGSQRTLNGFVLGQHREAVANTFTELLQEGTAGNGLTYQAFRLDREHGAYMVFQYSESRPDYLYAIQVTGDPGTNMRSFLGLRLGDPRVKVLTQLGNPSSTELNARTRIELLEYGPQRNFSIELDSLGQVYSIRIIGYLGFGDQPSARAVPSLDHVQEVVSGTDLDAVLDLLAGDVEIFRGDSVYRFERAAGLDLADSTSRMAQGLVAGRGSLRAVLTSAAIRGADAALRVYDDPPRSPNFVYTFSGTSPLTEIVLTADAGAWRIWEVRFR